MLAGVGIIAAAVFAVLAVVAVFGRRAKEHRRSMLAQETRDQAERHRSYGDGPIVPAADVPVFHAEENAR